MTGERIEVPPSPLAALNGAQVITLAAHGSEAVDSVAIALAEVEFRRTQVATGGRIVYADENRQRQLVDGLAALSVLPGGMRGRGHLTVARDDPDRTTAYLVVAGGRAICEFECPGDFSAWVHELREMHGVEL